MKLDNKIEITQFPNEEVIQIDLTEGNFVTIMAANNNIVDGRLILKREDEARPYLICFQIRFSEADKYLSEKEVGKSCQEILQYVVPNYPAFEVVLVMITNRPFAKGNSSTNQLLFMNR